MTKNIDKEIIEGADELVDSIQAHSSNLLEDAISDLILGMQTRANEKNVQSEIFYGRILAECRRVIVRDSDKGKNPHWVPTAAVALHKNQFLLIANLDFLGKLTVSGRRAVIKHEAQHLVHRHLFRFNENREARPNNQVANIAMDAVINQYNPHIQDMKMSDGKTFPEVKYTNIKNAKADDLWEVYYDLMQEQMDKQKKDDKKKKQECQKSKDGNPSSGGKDKSDEKGEGEPQEGQGGEGDKQESQGQGDPTDGQFGETIDDHSFFGQIDEETNPDMMEDAIKDSISKIARQVWAGNTPQEIEKILEQIRNESKVPWQTLLRNWMKMATQQTRNLNILKESTSVIGVYPGHKRTPVPEFHVYADMSGSIGDDQAIAFFQEVLAIQMRMKATVWLHQFDTQIHHSQKLERVTPDIKRQACGGTNFDCIVEHAKKNGNRNLIVMTDGYCGETDWTGLKALMVYTKNHHEHSTNANSIVLEV